MLCYIGGVGCVSVSTKCYHRLCGSVFHLAGWFRVYQCSGWFMVAFSVFGLFNKLTGFMVFK